MNHHCSGPGDPETWNPCLNHPHDPRTETEEDFLDEYEWEDEDLHEDEEEDDPLEA